MDKKDKFEEEAQKEKRFYIAILIGILILLGLVVYISANMSPVKL